MALEIALFTYKQLIACVFNGHGVAFQRTVRKISPPFNKF